MDFPSMNWELKHSFQRCDAEHHEVTLRNACVQAVAVTYSSNKQLVALAAGMCIVKSGSCNLCTFLRISKSRE